MTGHDCRFADGPFAGRKLGDAWREMPAEWVGTLTERRGRFPLLVKFLFPQEKLSVQVHPDDEYAARYEAAAGGRGKTEMWYVLRAQPGAGILLGMKPEVTADSFRRAIAEGTAEKCLESVPLSAGEAAFVPAGTAHTIGPGLVLCEIQEYSDLTYRVFDYNRRDAEGKSRPLQIEKALAVTRFGKQSGGKIQPVRITQKYPSSGSLVRTCYGACRYFAAERLEFAGFLRGRTSAEHFDLFIVLEGTGRMTWGEGDAHTADYSPAQVWMIPAALGNYGFAAKSPTTLLRTFVPSESDLDELVRNLADCGVDEAARSRLVHP